MEMLASSKACEVPIPILGNRKLIDTKLVDTTLGLARCKASWSVELKRLAVDEQVDRPPYHGVANETWPSYPIEIHTIRVH